MKENDRMGENFCQLCIWQMITVKNIQIIVKICKQQDKTKMKLKIGQAYKYNSQYNKYKLLRQISKTV